MNQPSLFLVIAVGLSFFGAFDGTQAQVILDEQPPARPDTTLLDDVRPPDVPKPPSGKWIGVLCNPVDEVIRAHLGIEKGVGLVVDRVVPDSPADRAGLQAMDILLSVDGEPLTGLDKLINATAEAGDAGIQLQRIRSGIRDGLVIVPEQRPAAVARLEQRPGFNNMPEMNRLKAWVERLEKDGQPMEGPLQFRFFGPGVPAPHADLPNNVSINIEKRDDEPARIRVQKGDDSWEVTEDAIDELPEDVRGHIRRMLQGDGMRLQFREMPWLQFDRRLDNVDEQLREMMEEIKRLRDVEQETDSLDA